MVMLISENYKNTTLESLIRNGEYVIGFVGRKRVGHKINIRDVTRVLFRVGEEKAAIKLFVDKNRIILESDINFRYKSSFYPQMLYKYYIKYLVDGELDDDIPNMPEYAIKRFRTGTRSKKLKFCEYMRTRCSKLLENPDSLLHDCNFLNKYIEDK